MKRRIRFENWNRNFSCRPALYAEPHCVEDVVQLVRLGHNEGKTLRPVGSGYSYTPLVQTDEILVSLNRIQGVERIDRDIPAVTVRGGTRLFHLNRFLASQGFALGNLGDIDRQTVAGAVSTATHGTGLGLGNISSEVLEITLVDGRGNLTVIQDRPRLRAAAVSLGAMGLMVSVKLKIVPHYWLQVDRKVVELDRALDELDRNVANHRNFEFFWFPNLDFAFTKTMNLTANRAAAGMQLFVRPVNDYLVENGILWVLNEWSRRFPGARDRLLNIIPRVAPQEVSFEPAERAYATPRWVRHNEIEYAIDIRNVHRALTELRRSLHEAGTRVLFPIEVRFCRRDDLYLSPSSDRDVAYISAHTYADEAYHGYFQRVEQIMKRFGGRPHWGKLHFLSGNDFAYLYPRWDDFHRERQTLDPEGLYLNPYLKTIFAGKREPPSG